MKLLKYVLFMIIALGLNSSSLRASAAFRRAMRPETERTMPIMLNKNQESETIRTKPKVESEIPVSSAPPKSHRSTISHTTPYQKEQATEPSYQPPKSTFDHIKEQFNNIYNNLLFNKSA